MQLTLVCTKISAYNMNLNEACKSNPFVGSSKEKFFYHNTLLCLVKSLQGRNITIDLRNDAYVCGNAFSVDGLVKYLFCVILVYSYVTLLTRIQFKYLTKHISSFLKHVARFSL